MSYKYRWVSLGTLGLGAGAVLELVRTQERLSGESSGKEQVQSIRQAELERPHSTLTGCQFHQVTEREKLERSHLSTFALLMVDEGATHTCQRGGRLTKREFHRVATTIIISQNECG